MVKNVYLLCSGSPPLECPYCDSFTSLEDCDKNAETQKCGPSETMCIVFKQEDVEADFPFRQFTRGCMDEGLAEYLRSGCTNNDYCQFGACQMSGCYASFET